MNYTYPRLRNGGFYTYPRLLYVQIYTYPSLSPNIPTPIFPSNPVQSPYTTNQISFLHGVTTDVFFVEHG